MKVIQYLKEKIRFPVQLLAQSYLNTWSTWRFIYLSSHAGIPFIVSITSHHYISLIVCEQSCGPHLILFPHAPGRDSRYFSSISPSIPPQSLPIPMSTPYHPPIPSIVPPRSGLASNPPAFRLSSRFPVCRTTSIKASPVALAAYA